MIKDYCELSKQNRRLKNGKKSSCEHSDEITTLQQENQILREEIDFNKNEANQWRRPSFETNCDKERLIECNVELELLKQQLAKKDETIEKLLLRNRNQSNLQECDSSESTSSDSIENNTPSRGNCLLRSQSDSCTTYRSCGSKNFSESEKRDTEKIQALEKGYKELTMILKEKYTQLRKQRTKIDVLTKRLESVADQETQLERLRRGNEQLKNQLKNGQNNVDVLNGLTKQIERCQTEVEQLRMREHCLARKITSQNEHIATLCTERTNLMKINDEMKRTISICKRELCKFCD